MIRVNVLMAKSIRTSNITSRRSFARHRRDEILRLYPYLEDEDIAEALACAAWRAGELEVPLSSQ